MVHIHTREFATKNISSVFGSNCEQACVWSTGTSYGQNASHIAAVAVPSNAFHSRGWNIIIFVAIISVRNNNKKSDRHKRLQHFYCARSNKCAIAIGRPSIGFPLETGCISASSVQWNGKYCSSVLDVLRYYRLRIRWNCIRRPLLWRKNGLFSNLIISNKIHTDFWMRSTARNERKMKNTNTQAERTHDNNEPEQWTLAMGLWVCACALHKWDELHCMHACHTNPNHQHTKIKRNKTQNWNQFKR